MVETTTNQRKTLLVAIYAPNSNLKKFYTKKIEKEFQHICLLGDFNAVVDEK